MNATLKKLRWHMFAADTLDKLDITKDTTKRLEILMDAFQYAYERGKESSGPK